MSKKTIVVVGAGQGLGNHVAERFAKEDFRLVLVARRSEALAEYKQEFEAKGYETSTVTCDVTDTESVKAAFEKINAEMGTPDVLVYNVGITTPDAQPLDENEVGLLRSIGVANFMEDNYLRLIENCQVIPTVNQIETHVYRQQTKMHQLLLEHGTWHESWSPLACGQNGFFRDQLLKQIADSHGKSIAQVGLR